MWDAYNNGAPEVGRQTILEHSGSESEKLLEVFKAYPVWSTTTVPGTTERTIRLAPQT